MSRSAEIAQERNLLMSGLRAEIAALHSVVLQQVDVTDTYGQMYAIFAKKKAPSSVKEYTFSALKAPVYMANISKLGAL